jgi:2,3-diketo-5-methylthio-1-phosphopentane phosphatase
MPSTAAPSWTLLCDFDGTISHDDATDLLLERFARAGWETLEADWKAGRIGSRACMAGQIALLDVDAAALDAAIDALRLDPHFVPFVQAVRRAGHELIVVSDGVDRCIRRSLARLGLSNLPVFSNRLEGRGPRDWHLAFPHADDACRRASGTCKCAVADASGPRRPTLLIGDGSSDFCVAGQADLVFAKGRLIDHCRSHGIRHHPIADFADALPLLVELQRHADSISVPA